MAIQLPSQRGRGRRTPMAEINVTPLVDVMLVLLIIFMVTAPLLVAGVKVQLPQSAAAALDQDQKPLDITLDHTGGIFIDKQPVAESALAETLAQAHTSAGDPPRQVYLRADKTLDYGRVMLVMGALSHAGFTKIAMVTVNNEPH
ncbi:MAG: protein TolR [Alphaproteobacteria bacterium]|nr:protein TolR [Alphaproteobacteria bacterium]MDE2341736.1 protein TolR [Alphaproteobacteria bacterium]